MTAYSELMAFARETTALEQVAGRNGWDQETFMPHGAADQRAEELAAMESMLHARRTDPRVGDWLAAAEAAEQGQVERAQLRHIRRSFDRANKVPAKLSSEIARVTSKAHRVWAEARQNDDFAGFAATVTEVVRLRREEAAALAVGGNLYDALLNDYEPGATEGEIAAMFDALRPRLVALRQAVLGKPAPKGLQGTFDDATQMKMARKVAKVFGYDMARGRVDKSVHPFTSGSGNDVRITTRTTPSDPFNCIYSTIHEVGHGAYEQNVDQAYLLTPIGGGVSMGVHESQSRIYENQLGRSRAFTGWLYDQMVEAYGDIGVADAGAFYAAVNTVHKGYIRTEADEVQYNLHIMLRFDLERGLIGGTLEVADLEEAWNARFVSDFGYAVDKASNGVLQDVHWSAGLFGYFPTYSLGNVYAGCLHQALRDAVPDLDAQLARGDTAEATSWLRESLQRHGGLYEPREVITRACGVEPSEAPLLDYLEAKFGALYGV
ncbi:carboxypeptidase M32 [Mesobacterium sp. TK19101]|uniref:Metal-dependent carboxypeptidase n=1 Tax=Mesobacterium hydrothermale TaxID=3111907 RepID=A0ABU6HDF3_9RHOB|nr:carboxypeptidase M32 [Mesobacterium sp. TK19101]MEC3860489.1 carboxypeptidase M32 [Mesobacterium sp. TK19101]